jgi:hypothetical protein
MEKWELNCQSAIDGTRVRNKWQPERSPHTQAAKINTIRSGAAAFTFHLAVVCQEGIRGQIDFAVCFPPKWEKGRPAHRPTIRPQIAP